MDRFTMLMNALRNHVSERGVSTITNVEMLNMMKDVIKQSENISGKN